MKKLFRLCFVIQCLAAFSLSAMLTNNPAQPAFQTLGIVQSEPSWWSFRLAYLDDCVYLQRFKDAYKIQGLNHTKTFVRFTTYAGMLTLNIKNRLDLYGIAGTTQMQVDQEVFTKQQLSWGIGMKVLIFQYGNFAIGGDIKYFESEQKPLFFVAEGLPYNIVTSNFKLKYNEVQAALGMTYRAQMIAPYVNATYLVSKIDPQPMVLLVRLPDENIATDITSKSVVGQRRWGMAVGATLIGSAKITLTVESRFFNQNGIDINGEIRF